MKFLERVKELKSDIKSRAEERKQRVASDLAILIAKAGLKRKDVSKRLEITEAALSIRLNGTANLTLDSISGICDATGFEFDVHFRRADEAPAMSFWEIDEANAPAKPIEKKEVNGEAWLDRLLNKNLGGVLYDVPSFKPANAANESLVMTKYEPEPIAA